MMTNSFIRFSTYNKALATYFALKKVFCLLSMIIPILSFLIKLKIKIPYFQNIFSDIIIYNVYSNKIVLFSTAP